MFPSQKLHLQHPVTTSLQDSSAPIAHSMCCIQVPKYHHRASNLQLQFCKWKPRAVDLIQILHRIVKHWIISSTLFRAWNKVCTVEHLHLPRELVKYMLVQAVHISIEA